MKFSIATYYSDTLTTFISLCSVSSSSDLALLYGSRMGLNLYFWSTFFECKGIITCPHIRTSPTDKYRGRLVGTAKSTLHAD